MSILEKIQKVVFDADLSEYTAEFETLFPKLVEATNEKLQKSSAGQLSLSTHDGSVKFEHLWGVLDSKVLIGEKLGTTKSIKYQLFLDDLFLSFTYVPHQDKVWYLSAKQGDVFSARKSMQNINDLMKKEIDKLKES